MSSQRGNASRQRPQKHQNSHAFRNSLHDTSRRTKSVNQMDFGGMCQRCKDVLDWKVKFKKYKVLSQPRKCIRCEQRCIGNAYLTVCPQCARSRAECQKCGQRRDLTPAAVPAATSAAAAAAVARSLESQMLQLRERDKRTFLRLLQAESFATSEAAAAWIEARLNGEAAGSGDGDDGDDSSTSGEEKEEEDEDDDGPEGGSSGAEQNSSGARLG